MSLRIRLFLIFGTLIAVLLGAQWYMLRTLTNDLAADADDLAFSVSQGVASVFIRPSDPQHIVRELAAHGTEDSVGFVIDETKAKPPSGHHSLILKSRSFDGKVVVKRQTITGDEPQILVGNDSVTHVISLDENDSSHTWVSTSQPPHESAGDLTQTGGKVADRVMAVAVSDNEMVEHMNLSLATTGENNFIYLTSPSINKKIPINKNPLTETLATMYNQYLLGSLGILLVGLLVVAMVSHGFSAPLRRLASTAQMVGEGRLGVQVNVTSGGGEVGIAIHEFNKMSVQLRELDNRTQMMRQRENLSELGEIADGLAHTIRNPLNTLGLSVEQMVAQTPDTESNRELAHVARQQIRRIDQWIRSFLALASQGTSSNEEIRMDGLIHDVMLEALGDGSAKVELVVELAEDLPVCHGVGAELRAVVQALVVNAVEASPAGGRLWIRANPTQDGGVCIQVEDEGSGLPRDVRDKLFSPHVTTKVTGSGMGLFLAKRIITTRYNGSLTLNDRQPNGVLAELFIPREKELVHG